MGNVTKEQIEETVCKEGVLLLATHKKLCVPVINRIYRKMKAGIPVPVIKVSDNLICDGHHRYVASLLAQVEVDTIQTHKTSATTIIQWEEVVFENDDWDVYRRKEIDRINQQDAEYLQIEVQKLLEMLN